MVTSIRIQDLKNPLEHRAFEQRLDKLGIDSDPGGVVDPRSARGVVGPGGRRGVQALEAVARDGVLTPEGAAQLEKRRGLLAALQGRQPTPDETQTNEVRSAALSCKGLARACSAATKKLAAGERIPNEVIVEAFSKRCDQIRMKLDFLARTELADCDPKAVRTLAEDANALSQAAARYRAAVEAAWNNDRGPDSRVEVLELERCLEDLHESAKHAGAYAAK